MAPTMDSSQPSLHQAPVFLGCMILESDGRDRSQLEQRIKYVFLPGDKSESTAF